MSTIKILVLSGLLISTALFSQEKKTTLDSALKVLSTNEMFHGQVLVAEKGQVQYSGAFGKTNEQLITSNTSLSIESVTKTFTALAVLMLKEKNKLTLDDQLTYFFPQLPYQGVTVRHLLTMTSGLPRFFETALRYGDTTRFIQNDEIIALIAKHQPDAQSAGEYFNYNNTNYLLLASVIEKVSGQSYGDFLNEHVLVPLKMKNTHIIGLNEIKVPANADNFYQPYGEGNILSTAEDIFRLDKALASNVLLSQNTLAQLFNPVIFKNGEPGPYGMGWFIDQEENHKSRIVGDGEGSRCIWEKNFKDGTTFIYLHTHSVEYGEPIYKAIQDIWYENTYEIPTKRIAYDIDKRLYHNYTGSYLSPIFGLLHISESGGKLFLRPDPVPGKEELVPSSDTTFFFANQPVEWEFFKDENGKVIGLGMKGDRASMGPKQK